MKMTTIMPTATTATQPRPTENSARVITSSLENRLNGGSPSRATNPMPNRPPHAGRRASSVRIPSIRVVPSTAKISPDVRTSTVLARPCPRIWRSTGRDGQPRPGRRPEGDQASC